MTRVAIVFVHGLLGFSKFGFTGMKYCYFKGLCEALGEDVYFPSLPGSGSIEERSRKLAKFINHLPHNNIHIVAHSMGGLDARYVIQHLDPKHRIKRLITIATPHHGSVISNWVLETPNLFIAALSKIVRPAVNDLTPLSCENFNANTPDRDDVQYWSYSSKRPLEQLPFWLKPWGKMLSKAEGENDGMVSVKSAQWGEYKGALAADHFELVGWRILPFGKKRAPRFEHKRFYQQRVKESRPLTSQ